MQNLSFISAPGNSKKTNATGIRQKEVFFQPKLTINAPGDEYEQEADATADTVMRMTDTSLQKQTFFTPAVSTVQRKCKECEEEKSLQRKEASAQHTEANTEVSSYINSLSSKGSFLSKNTRSFFEHRLGYDFSGVKIHTDSDAVKSAQSINALAYTTGNHVIFNQNQFSPESENGKKLLAHELTHVVQQNNLVSWKMVQRKCADNSVKSSQWVAVKNEYDFTAVDGYTPLSGGRIVDVLFDGKNYFFCYNDKRVYIKYSDSESGAMQDFEKMYGIKVKNGGDTWKPSELAVVSEALASLSPAEVSGVHGYHFIKEGGVRIEDGDKVTAGLTTQDIIHNDYTIQFWKFCFDGTADIDVPQTSLSKGVPCVLHEIGHALMFARRRPLMEAMYFKDKYEKMYENASPEKQKRMKPKLSELIVAEDKAEKDNSGRPTVDAQFFKLTKGKKALTDYSKKNEDEAFAEAFAIYKINPDLLKKKNPKLYTYFLQAGYQ